MGTTTFKLHDTSSGISQSFAAALARSVSNMYAFAVSQLSARMRPQAESPAEAAQRLRTMAESYADQQPSYAADLRAAADLHDAARGA